jgi:hypothetical protein
MVKLGCDYIQLLYITLNIVEAKLTYATATRSFAHERYTNLCLRARLCIDTEISHDSLGIVLCCLNIFLIEI